MIYPENFESRIGFDQIRQLVSDRCLSTLGKERVDAIRFSDCRDVISGQLDQTDEFMRILQGDREFPSDHFMDLRHALSRIRPEGTFLDGQELFDLKRSLQTIHDIVRFFLHTGDGTEATARPALTALAGGVPVFPEIIRQIDAVLDKYGKIRDQASPELMQIRREMNATAGSISRSLQQILRTARAEGLVDRDAAPTVRDGRLVIPVAPAFKRRIRGIIHDESASGKTVFIEPEAVVEANNRIRELESRERREIIRILTALTALIRPLAPDMLHAYAFLAEIDLIRAKALFALQIGAIRPTTVHQPLVDWTAAVHPLLYLSHQKQNKSVEPLDITLDGKGRILVISGPNAGGKSVCLKTVGLLQYMMQCGLPVPLHERSRMGLFSRIFIDIGDEQSLENDLSTYSSHLMHMNCFVRNGHAHTLLLIDEFGSGTEPLIGGAIAEALLEEFNRNGSFGIITTHYPNLKQYADRTEGLVNGAMLCDRHRMQPLFKLSIGLPGSSFAIEIARKIGLPEEVIAKASARAGSGYIETDKFLQDIVRDKRYWENKRQSIRQQEKRLEELTARYEQALETLDGRHREVMKTARQQAEQLLAEANARIENTIREIREVQAEKEHTRLVRQTLEHFKASLRTEGEGGEQPVRRIRTLRERPAQNRKSGKQPAPVQEEQAAWAVGDAVRLKGQQAVGTVLALNGKQAVIALGMIKSTVKTEQLEKVSRDALRGEPRQDTFLSRRTADEIHEKKLTFKPDIDLRGMRGDEALQAVTSFIDDAVQTDAGRVRILHGTGNGILRRLIREYLRTVSGVRYFQDEHVQFGGAGITVVELE
ncbi:MAG: Smr/MutS family protein [Tannerella sp.]|nr:Smr/MutS family protein [Tannerella sp.]